MSAKRRISDEAAVAVHTSGVVGGDLIRRSPAMLHVLGSDGVIEAVSDEWLEQLGYRENQVIGRCIVDFLTDECRAALSGNCFQTVFDIGKVRGASRVFRKSDGRALPVELSANAYHDSRSNVRRLIAVMQKAAGRSNAKKLLSNGERCLSHCDAFIGHSDALQQVCDQIERVAATSASVMVSGESGVGKELVARAIHAASERREQPMIKINCAAVPRELFESEFFGHVKGSFTGAWRNRLGKFELAEGGTLFLDEITEMPLDLQTKLLRVLEEGTFERVGDDRTRKVDVRIIAASNRDLIQAVHEGQLRTDLYYRLNVFPITMPPLRERPTDIIPLAEHFLKRASESFAADLSPLSVDDIAALHAYDWPGNVRELRNIIDLAVINSKNGELRVRDAIPSADFSNSDKPDNSEYAPLMTEAEWQRRYRDNLESALIEANWKIEGAGGAARLLGMKPSTLRYRIKSLGIGRPALHTV